MLSTTAADPSKTRPSRPWEKTSLWVWPGRGNQPITGAQAEGGVFVLFRARNLLPLLPVVCRYLFLCPLDANKVNMFAAHSRWVRESPWCMSRETWTWMTNRPIGGLISNSPGAFALCMIRLPVKARTHIVLRQRDINFVSGRPRLKHRQYDNPPPATPSARAKHTAHNERPSLQHRLNNNKKSCSTTTAA